MNNAEQTITPIVDSPREIGIQAADRQNIAERLSEILAGTYGLLIKTQIIHWNTHGMRFFEIHKLTEAQYNTLFAAIDVIAERVITHLPVIQHRRERALGDGRTITSRH